MAAAVTTIQPAIASPPTLSGPLVQDSQTVERKKVMAPQAPVDLPRPTPAVERQPPPTTATTTTSTTSTATAAAPPRRDRPCDACRRRKTRCVMLEDGPVCSSCRMHKQLCTFVENPLPRKRRAQSEGPEAANGKRRQARSSIVSAKEQLPASPSVSQSPSHAASNELRNANRSMEPLEPASIIAQRPVRHVGATTQIESSLWSLCHVHGQPEDAPAPAPGLQGNLYRLGNSDTFLVQSEGEPYHGHQYITRTCLNAIEAIVAPFGPVLVELYMKFVHPSFPVLEARDFVARYRQLPINMPPALLAAVYLLALHWWPTDDRLRGRPMPDVSSLETLAFRSLEWAIQRPDLATVQAGLLLLQRSDGETWAMTARIIAIGQDLGLHLDPSAWHEIPAWERGLRKRVAWALFMQDKWGALVHGRPSHLVRSNWAVGTLVEDDFEPDAPPPAPSERHDATAGPDEPSGLLFGSMVSLTVILSEVLDTFYTLQAMHEIGNAGKDGTRIVLDRAKPVQIKLKEWFARLPTCLRMDRARSKTFSSLGSLHVAYFATEITLHRRIVHSLDLSLTDPYLVHICRSAAKTRLISAMDFVNRLKVEHLQSFWHSASKVNFALIGTFGGLLLATSPSEQEADFYRLRLGEYRWTLSVSAKWARFMVFALGTLDKSMKMLQNLDEKPSLTSQFKSFDLYAKDERRNDTSSAVPTSSPESTNVMQSSTMDPPSGLASPSISASTGPSRPSTPAMLSAGSDESMSPVDSIEDAHSDHMEE